MNPRFSYRGWQNGKPVRGSLRASDLEAARRWLLARQILPDEVRPARRQRRFTEAELIGFCRGMASLLRAGVPLAEAGTVWLTGLRNQAAWEPVFHAVLAGKPLARALSQTDRIPPFVVAMVSIGEATGSLQRSLEQTAAFLGQRRQLRQTLVTALTYPAIVAVVAVTAMAILIFYVLPIFEEMYRRFDTQLPTATQVLLGSLAFLKAFGLWLILGLIVTLLLFWQWSRVPANRLRLDRWSYRIPLAGNTLAAYHEILFCQSLGHLLESGVGLLEGLDILQPLIPNRAQTAKIAQNRAAVARGVNLAQTLAEAETLSPRTVKMVAIAEQSGSLGSTLTHLAREDQMALDLRLKRFASLFEPALILGMAIVIGLVLVALYLPMFDIVQIME